VYFIERSIAHIPYEDAVCACCHTVVVYCVTDVTVMARFLFRAQDRNMTNGDFAFFTYQPVRLTRTLRPWIIYMYYNAIDPKDFSRRQRAFYALKQVRVITFNLLFRVHLCSLNATYQFFQRLCTVFNTSCLFSRY